MLAALASLSTLSWGKIGLKILPYAASILAFVGIVSGIYFLGSHHGAARVQTKWDSQKAADTIANQKALIKLRSDAAQKEQVHQQKSQEISDELSSANEKYAASVASIRTDYAQRLRNSEQRSTYYQRMSTAGTVEQTNLASHAAELDRSLEEGRQLVQELSANLRQRDAQVSALGQQILTDRALVGEKDGQSSVPAK